MGQALYRAYRPKSLREVVGQEHITSSLVHALKHDKIAHAYLFTGPRGTGKTSIARILAHEINGIAYTDDSMHLDIIEIDAASNRRIDEIRELRDKVNVAPSLAKYKVYIIDEVHMLTREAFNALLKTLEEPPAHVVFILATTESHKLPDTIISRTQRYMFKPVAIDKVVAHLRSIADGESMMISDEALKLIAEHGEGSFRDSISLLDQVRGQDGTIDEDAVRALTGVPTTEAIEEIYAALNNSDAQTATQSLIRLRDQGFGAAPVAKQLGKHIRQQVIDGSGTDRDFTLMQKLLEVPVSHDPDTYLELTILAHTLEGTMTAVQPTTKPQPSSPPQSHAATSKTHRADVPNSPTPAKAAHTPSSRPQLSVVAKPQPSIDITPVKETPKQPPTTHDDSTSEDDLEQDESGSRKHGTPLAEVDAAVWPAIVSTLKKTHNTLYGIIRMATPIFYEDAIELHFTFAFHKKRLSEAKNQEVVSNVIKEVTGRAMGLRCVLDSKDAPKPTQASAAMQSDQNQVAASEDRAVLASPISAISNIFGGAEVLDK